MKGFVDAAENDFCAVHAAVARDPVEQRVKITHRAYVQAQLRADLQP